MPKEYSSLGLSALKWRVYEFDRVIVDALIAVTTAKKALVG